MFANRSGPIAAYGLRPCYRPKKATSGDGDGVNPNDPALIVNQLESTKAGCEWLRDEWLELRRLLEPTLYWTGMHRLKAVRLLGRQPVDLLEDDRVALIFFAAHRLNPVGDDPFSDLGTDIDSSLLGRLELDAVAVWPDLIDASEEAPAREILVGLVEQNIERLDEMLAKYTENADVIKERRLIRLRMDDSPQSKSIRDFKLKSVNAYYRGLDACEKYRKRHKDESRPRREGEIPLADGARGEPIDQRQRREDGWKQAEDLSFAYEAIASFDRASRAWDEGDEVGGDEPRDSSGAHAAGDSHWVDRINGFDDTTALDGGTVQVGATGTGGEAGPIGCDLRPASDGEVAIGGLGAGGAAETGSSASNKGNEAKLDENVNTSQIHEPVDVVADFGDGQGLDNVAVEPFQVDGLEIVDAGIVGDTRGKEDGRATAGCGEKLVRDGTGRDFSGTVGNYRGDAAETCGDGGPDGSATDVDVGTGRELGCESIRARAAEQGAAALCRAPVRSIPLWLAGEAFGP